MVKPVEIDPETGLDEGEFVQEIEHVYDEAIAIATDSQQMSPSSIAEKLRDKHGDCCLTNSYEDHGCKSTYKVLTKQN